MKKHIMTWVYAMKVKANLPDLLRSRYGKELLDELSEEQMSDLFVYAEQSYNRKFREAYQGTRVLRSFVINSAGKYLGYAIQGERWVDFNRLLLNPRVAGCFLWDLDDEGLQRLNRKLKSMIDKKRDNDNRLDVAFKTCATTGVLPS